MEEGHVYQLFGSGTITARQRDTLLRLVRDGVRDPCMQGETPATCKLFYTNLPDRSQRGGAIEDARQIVLQRGHTVDMHRKIASALHENSRCMPLNTYLNEWLALTTDSVVVEAVSWIWLDACGDMKDKDAFTEYHGQAVSARSAAEDPSRLIRVLSGFKRQFSLRFNPSQRVDELALKLEWWALDSEMRADALVFAKVDEVMEDNEWVPIADLVTDSLSVVNVTDTMERLGHRVVRVGTEGVTYPHIWNMSRAVRDLVDEYASTRLDPHPPQSLETSLTEEQETIRIRVLEGHRLTMCCSPAGTGKTHMASAIATHPAFLEPMVDGDRTYPGHILCLAPTHKALSVLRNKLPTVVAWDPTRNRHVSGITFMTVQRLTVLDAPPHASIVIVDETSMLTMRMVKTILGTYVHLPTRLLFLGDDVQLPCIGRGSAIQDLKDVVPTFRLTRCMRTDGVGLVDAATKIRDGQTVTESPGEVEIIPCASSSETIAKAVSYVTNALPPWDPQYVQIISPLNVHVNAINEGVQDSLGTSKTTPALAHTQWKCYVGDPVRFESNTETYRNGDEGVVSKITTKRAYKGGIKATATVDRRSDSSVDVKYEPHIRPAYASTVHKSQGSEYGTVVLALFSQTPPSNMTREMVYTSVTRARTKLCIVGATGWLTNLTTTPRRTVFPHL